MPPSEEKDEEVWEVDTFSERNPLVAEMEGPEHQAKTVVRCRECAGQLERLEHNVPAPVGADAAWKWAVSHNFQCLATKDGATEPWSFCPRTGIAWVHDNRISFERRQDRAERWLGEDRRHPRVPPNDGRRL